MAQQIARAFYEGYVTAGLLDENDFSNYQARQLRYAILWAFYENTAYRDLHAWAQGYRNRYGLYKHIRNIYNPAYRLAEFHVGTIWGGGLNPDALQEGAIPIEIVKGASEGLRESIARLWQDSNWAVNKDIVTLWGATLGDVGVRVVDDVDAGRVYLEYIHPSTIKEIEINSRGFVKSYAIEEEREDNDGKDATYLELAYRGEDEQVVYETYRNGKPYGWGDRPDTWTELYGFIPFVMIRHRNVGLPFGWAEVHPLRSKMNEIDDQASLLNDQVRKMVNTPWLFNFAKPRSTPAVTGADATTDKPQPGREELPALYIDKPEAKGQALVSDLDVEQVLNGIQKLLEEMERDFPELQMDIWSGEGDTSGKALGEARKRVEAKIVQRRSSYDSDLVRAQQMAIAIGGEKGYEGFQGYNLGSFKAGALNHRIAVRPVFPETEAERIARKKMIWETVSTASDDAIPAETVLRDMGYKDEDLKDLGTQKLASIRARQEDRIPPTRQ